jgi:hypothetical protein
VDVPANLWRFLLLLLLLLPPLLPPSLPRAPAANGMSIGL